MIGTLNKIRVYTAKSRFLWVGVVFIPQGNYEPLYADNTPFVELHPDTVIGYTAFTKKHLIDKITKRIKQYMQDEKDKSSKIDVV